MKYTWNDPLVELICLFQPETNRRRDGTRNQRSVQRVADFSLNGAAEGTTISHNVKQQIIVGASGTMVTWNHLFSIRIVFVVSATRTRSTPMDGTRKIKQFRSEIVRSLVCPFVRVARNFCPTFLFDFAPPESSDLISRVFLYTHVHSCQKIMGHSPVFINFATFIQFHHASCDLQAGMCIPNMYQCLLLVRVHAIFKRFGIFKGYSIHELVKSNIAEFRPVLPALQMYGKACSKVSR